MINLIRNFAPALLLIASIAPPLAAGAPPHRYLIDKVIDVAPVWSGHPVGFALLTHGDMQFVAFY